MKLQFLSSRLYGWWFVGGLALLAGCASTTLTSSWKDQNYLGGPLKNVAVFVMVSDEGMRRFAEDQMVQKMPKGTSASPGYLLYEKPGTDKDKVREDLIKRGFDGVLVSRLVAVDKSRTYVPPQTHFVPGAPYFPPGVYAGPPPFYGNFVGYYGLGYGMVQTSPGYTVENTTVVVETILYKLPEDKPLWTGTTRSIDPGSRPEMVQAITELVESEMSKKGLIGSPVK